MRRRRRKAANPVSLFAFQDIITSATAIMILLVLIMTLELVTSGRSAGVTRDHATTAADLRSSVTELERTASALKQDVSRLQAAADRAASWDVADLRRALTEARVDRHRREAAMLKANTAAFQATAERREAERQLMEDPGMEAVNERMIRDLDEARRRIEAHEAAHSSLRRQQTIAESNRAAATQILVFNPTAGDERRPRLVEISTVGVAVMENDGRTVKQLGWGLFGPPTAFAAWLAGIDGSAESVVLLVRPSGATRYDVVRQVVVDAGLDVGTELAAEDAAVTIAAGQGPR